MSIEDPKIVANKTYNCPLCGKGWVWNEWAENSWFSTTTAQTCDECRPKMTREQEMRENGVEKKESPYPEFVPEYIKDERKKYAKDIVQSHRQGELSQEFVENYGDKLLDQVKDGVLSSDEIRRSKNVWGRDLPGIESQKGKYTKEEIVHRAQEIERKRNR